MNSNKKFLLMIIGVIVVAIFWIGWVSTNPADEKAMATFVSVEKLMNCLLYTSPSPRDRQKSRMPSSA